VRLRSINLNLGHHGEAHAVVFLAKTSDLVVAAFVLRPKLVAGKAQHHQAPAAKLLVQRFQTSELRREATCAGGVHDQQGFAGQVFQCERLAVNGEGLKIKSGGHAVLLVE